MLLPNENLSKSQTELPKSPEPEEEHPPPYYIATGSSSRASRRASVLPPLPLETQSVPSFSDFDPRASAASIGTPLPPVPGSSGQVRLETSHADITGTFHIEPKPPMPELTNKKKKKKARITPDGIFRTRSGKIAVDLSTSGHVRDAPKASVLVVSKSGNITLNLLDSAEMRPRLELDVKSKSGTIVIFFPKSFAGAIQLHTRGGTLEFLPAISRLIQVVKSNERESLVLFGRQIAPSSQLPSDFCHVLTRSGNVFIGLLGEDSYIAKLGLWERIGVFFKGSP
ncbi:hypothetical protein FB45DRAFT_1031159 [Roridomyces roridus]|uniref:DUF7330 domain-containing protein n=1 Tax=Roridomyces roridus TaxID=1738132 RepID=A0AAD7BJJ5_9AGAR|nr:hypothetical protein FB45DRAFT_1031159 [Roridomyces roridus]